MTAIFSSIVAFVTTVALIFLLRPVARSVGLVDIPNERSSHEGSTPLIGGIAIFGAVTVAYFLLVAVGKIYLVPAAGYYFLASLLLVVIGAIDDYKHLSPLVRFAGQIIASLIMIFGAGIVISDIGAISLSGRVVELGWLSVPFTVFATLGIINALNMSDGLDGLSGTMALISLIGLLIAAWVTGAALNELFLLIIGGGVLGFLMFNLRIFRRQQASIFMGDAGSMYLGFSLTWFAISLAQGPERSITPAAALWFMAMPIFDTVSMMFRRVIRRRSPFEPDKEHIHHVFMMAGFSVNETIAMMAAAALIGVGIGVLSMDIRAPEFSVAGLFVIAGLLYLWMMLRAWKVMQFIERSICRRVGDADRRTLGERREDSVQHEGEERRSGLDRRVSKRRTLVRVISADPDDESDSTRGTDVLDVSPRSD
jgi:UDP-GlcNAc:undecaprenyl-phosphate GlcNAc-1-phosphate transferase